MAQLNTTDMTGEKPLEDVDTPAQDSPTPPQSVWEAKHAGTGALHRLHRKRKVFVSRNAKTQAFAERLQAAMNRSGLSPSEVARRAWGTVRDKRGHNTAKNRDSVGHYMNGTRYPSPDSMQRLADAVGISVEELAGEPPAASEPDSRPQGSFAKRTTVSAASGDLILTSLPAQPTKIRIQVDRVIHWKLAARIQAMLKEAETGETVEEDGPQPGDVIQGGSRSA